MSLFGNMGALQTQQQPATMGTMPAQAQDPQSQYLAQALKAIGSTPSQGNPMGLSSNLLAEALLKYKQDQLQRQQQSLQNPSPMGVDPSMSIANGGGADIGSLF